MNERIRELTEQAEEWVCKNYPDAMDDNDEFHAQTMEKFAELLVKECALVAKTLPHTPERHWVQDSVTYIPVHCEQNILKHFGVEE